MNFSKNLLIEGWREINHSFALINQYQIRELLKKGAIIKVFDPQAMINAKIEMKDLFFCNNAYDTCVQSKGLIIATEWNEFRALDLKELKKLLSQSFRIHGVVFQ